MRTLIKNGTIATASDLFKGDLLIEDERIALLGTDLSRLGPFDQTIDAIGKYVVPGGIDPHTHLDMPFGGTKSADDFETGTRAAAFGGTTCVVDFAIQPQKGSLRQGLEEWHAKAEGKACIDYAFHMIARDINQESLAEMDRLVKQDGVPSFKLFTAYPGVFLVDDASIFRAMQKTGENGGLICMHAENGPVIDVLIEQALAKKQTAPKYHALTRPARLEAEATNRVIAFAEVAQVPVYIVHLSAREALAEVREARDRGIKAMAETCPQYLFLSYDNYEEPGFDGAKYVMSPPLRPKGNEEALWAGLKQDDLALVSTDHCPFCMKEQKELGLGNFAKIPNGIGGVEHRMDLIYQGVVTGKVSKERWVELCSTTPARMFGLYPKKGVIQPGSDADIVIYDPSGTTRLSVETHHMNMDHSAYEGILVDGHVDLVMSRGTMVIDGGQFVGRAGHGRYVPRGLSQYLI